MMPLTLASVGEENIILKVGGRQKLKKHLEDLGFIAGSTVTVVATMGGSLIVNIKDSRVALSLEVARHIMV